MKKCGSNLNLKTVDRAESMDKGMEVGGSNVAWSRQKDIDGTCGEDASLQYYRGDLL